MLKRKVHISIDISTIAFYLSIFVWNILILTLIDNDVIKFYSYIYFFPWALGNILLLINLYFSVYTESEFKEGDKFEWYEKRVIVVEKNTSTIITLISFMLPLTFSKLSQVPTILSIFFIANIFCTCLSMGLIWTPHTNIRFISALKTLKTIFYTYSITILMICIIMVMSNI